MLKYRLTNMLQRRLRAWAFLRYQSHQLCVNTNLHRLLTEEENRGITSAMDCIYNHVGNNLV